MNKRIFTSTILLCSIAQWAWAWDGSGTQADPYQIQSSADWKELSQQVSTGNTYSGQYFVMTTDIDTEGVSVGTETSAFSGTFDGKMYTLVYNRGGANDEHAEWVNDYCAPFVRLDGATVRNLQVTGQVFSSHLYAAGIVSRIGGASATTLYDCHVSSVLHASNSLLSNASFGGLVGIVNSDCKVGPTLQNCSFTGEMQGWAYYSACMVGWTSTPVTFKHCMVDPAFTEYTDGCATYIRTPENMVCPMEECYFTKSFGISQGEAVFNTVHVPDGCNYEIVSESTVNFDGKRYWQSGAVIALSVPDNIEFNHWEANHICQISDPWTRNGSHVVRDLRAQPSFTLVTSMPEAKLERTMDGTRYRYLSSNDYFYYLSKEYCDQKGYYIDDDGWLVKMVDGTKVFVTAVTGWEGGSIPSDGAQIHNDLTGDWRDHTLMACIAPHAFDGCTELKTLYFKDTDATHYSAKTKFDFIIGNYAFANCPNLTEVKMMQYTTEGTNHWEALKPEQIGWVGAEVFEGSPQAYFSTDASQYQSYLNDDTWTPVNRRVVLYDHIHEDMKVGGAIYSDMRNTAGEYIKNDAAGHAALMETLRYWNADYQQFTASSLLSNSSKNIWYTQVVGVDDNTLWIDSTMNIYNDPGSQYNYKTIALKSLGANKTVRNIVFNQTNGLSNNSYSDLKMVIRNGAFKGCDNLREIYLFYATEDEGARIVGLGPQDVIPGDDIFGLQPDNFDLDDEEKMNELHKAVDLMNKVRFIVSTNRYQEFLDDPNWQPYIQMLVPQDFPDVNVNPDFTKDNVTYGFLTNPGGIYQTSQTVSQDVSWWTMPRIMLEVALFCASIYSNIRQAAAEAVVVEADNGTQATINSILEQQKIVEYCTTHGFKYADAYEIPDLQERVISNMTKLGGLNVKNGLGLSAETSNSLLKFFGEIHILESDGVTLMGEDAMKGVLETLTEQQLKNLEWISRTCNKTLNAALSERFLAAKKAVAATIKELQTQVPNLKFSNYPSSAEIKKVLKQITDGLTLTSSYFSTDRFPYFLIGATTANVILANDDWGQENFNADNLRKGMRDNILSNMHQVSMVGGGYVITTPQKNLVYHTYVKSVPDQDVVTIMAGTDNGGLSANTTTAAIARDAFRDKKNILHVRFRESEVTTNETMPMVIVLPDSVFAGCTRLNTLDLRLQTTDGGTQALGPENFVLAGNDVFGGVNPDRFVILIDPSRKDDFLANDSWAPYEKYFMYESAQPKTQYQQYGGNYAYAYENGSARKVHKSQGHWIDHTIVTGPYTEFLQNHDGALKLVNDIGQYGNYQLDGVAYKAFYGNQDLKNVNFLDLDGLAMFGDCYSDLSMKLQDSCFAYCKNLDWIDMVYFVTDGDNHIDPISPSQVTIGQGVLEGTNARIKMSPEQYEWFMADSSWVRYKDRFIPCLIQPADKGFRAALDYMVYYDPAHINEDQSTWKDYIDLSRFGNWGSSKLRENLVKHKDDVLSLADFKHFESIGLTSINGDLFNGLDRLSNVVLPNTIKSISNCAFANCTSLQEIELPKNVAWIFDDVFTGCTSLKTIIVRNPKPATLGENTFPKNEGMKIYVPAQSLDQYLADWAEYKDYIVSDASYNVNKVITLDQAGTLADKLGLYVEWSYTGTVYAGDEPRYIHGNYAKYDSLTISGPLNDLDLAVIRYLGGCDSYERGGKATDGRLRYLNLYDARIVKDDNQAHYVNLSWGMTMSWQSISADDELPPHLFHNCTALETIILPRRLTYISHQIFEGCSSLKRVAITGLVKEYDGWQYVGKQLDYPLEELVLLTDQHATTTANNPWGQPIGYTFAFKSQVGDYMNDNSFMACAQNILAPFSDDHVMTRLAEKGEFFPSVYLPKEDVEDIFEESEIGDFDDFAHFQNVKRLVSTFKCSHQLRRITLPASIKSIGIDAFTECYQLDTIRVLGTEPAELAEDAFRDLPDDFRILVPRRYAKLYRTRWEQYADHINADDTYVPGGNIRTVTVTEPNTLAQALGLEISTGRFMLGVTTLNSVRGDYSDIQRLKVIGPIGAFDIDLLKYMAGYCQWTQSRNFSGHLEYLDLYDADIKQTGEIEVNCVRGEYKSLDGSRAAVGYYVLDDMLPQHSFLRAYSLRTLILPKTCKQVENRALQECEGLETLVLGDNMKEFNWNALDDDAMLTRMYILAKEKVEIDTECPIWRWLCNNYNPTFDAFYVRPSLYRDYLNDDAYTGSSWQRTNNISTGIFDDDASFCAFAAHGAATMDELATISTVKDWFISHKDVRDLSALRYTSIDYLDKGTLAPLSELEQIALPTSLYEMEEGLFEANRHLRSVDFMWCDSTDIVAGLRDGGFKKYGINTQQTLAYMPETYGSTTETNVVLSEGGKLHAETFRLTDSLSYVVPYEFEATRIENSRSLPTSSVPYTLCLPYKMNIPKYTRAYKLDSRDGTSLVFTEIKGELETMQPYLLKVVGNKRLRRSSTTLDTDISQTVPATDVNTFGRQVDAPGYSMRGTFEAIDNAEAAQMGAYILQNDGDWHPVSSATEADRKACILPFRAFLLPSARNASSRISMKLEDETTGIDTIETVDEDGTRRYYDLSGRLLDEKPGNGIFISNGQKEMKK